MGKTLIEDAFGDPRNAEALAWASDFSYYPEAEAKAKFHAELGLEARLFSAGNTQAYVATNDDHVVVAFRGTESPTSLEGVKDWLLTDAVDLLIVPEGRLGTDLAAAGVGARFHQGFVNAIAAIWDPVREAVDREMNAAERPLWITGHSLGGALALLAAWLFLRRMVPVHQIYTFGGPMIGNDLAVTAFDREFAGKIFRYVNVPDPVPKLPTVSLVANQYSHCQREITLGAAGATGAAADFFHELGKKTVDGILNATLLDDVWNGLKERIGAHGMASYRGLLADLFKE
ncbi:MAG: lipase family protein [Planctomycetia bacterium]|nr:lipase family protein [Planctomycetia bacterium]